MPLTLTQVGTFVSNPDFLHSNPLADMCCCGPSAQLSLASAQNIMASSCIRDQTRIPNYARGPYHLAKGF